MGDETRTLIERVQGLLALPPRNRAPIEDALTEGYARALALEAERRRLEARIAELAESLSTSAGAERVSELAELANRRARADVDLTCLRDALGSLRRNLATAAVAAV